MSTFDAILLGSTALAILFAFTHYGWRAVHWLGCAIGLIGLALASLGRNNEERR
ncbi:hypothetical protein [Methylobacterium nodulans]|uniref:Uncharacterized protein n=1 Tax=Methylobacterium nodulans (strain LMG 21967 / CNCM I-2342 / ORS 2060) TaxID=460265 RepID=B8IV36_METNO|nr:hypothetical protein [Methylobacterium nodulans]ACL59094.1 hypothetical protein Mnod_4218 [Methylobacterium nodulans ORS 2060]